MTGVSFASEQTKFAPDNQHLLISWIQTAIEAEGFSLTALTFIFCSDDYLLDINRKFLSHDYYTDVITFDYSEGNSLSGDVFISIDRVRENALDAQVSESDEVHRVMIHGVLHLLGYADKSAREKSQMTLKEDFYLSSRPF